MKRQIHGRVGEDEVDDRKGWMGGHATLTHQLGGEFVHLHGRSVATALVEYIHKSLATEVILGHQRRARRLPGDTTSQVIRRLSGVDMHILRSRVPDAVRVALPPK